MSDPTGTGALRRSFLAEGNRRLAQLRTQTHGILVAHDLMAAKNDPLAQFLPNPGERLSMFSTWFESTANRWLLNERWWERFLQRAYESGTVAGHELLGATPHGFMAIPNVYREMAQREFAGITATMIQQVTRQAGVAALNKRKPALMYRQVLAVLKKIGQVRLKAAVNFMTVQLHNAARLATYRTAGIVRIGIDPELLEPPRPSRFLKHDHLVLDATKKQRLEAAVREAEAAVEAAQTVLRQAEAEQARAEAKLEVANQRVQTEANEVSLVEGEVAQAEANLDRISNEDPDDRNYERRVAQAELMLERAEAKLERAEARREAAEDRADEAERELDDAKEAVSDARDELDDAMNALREAQIALEEAEDTEAVNVLTAGDNKVCNVCQGLADNGPYDLDEAQTILPAHPNCRCSWVPAEDDEE